MSWENPRKKEVRKREESRGRKQDRSEIDGKRQEVSRIKNVTQERPSRRYGERDLDFRTQNIKKWPENENVNKEASEDTPEERKTKAVTQDQAKTVHVEDVLCQILNKLDRIEEMQMGAKIGLADYF